MVSGLSHRIPLAPLATQTGCCQIAGIQCSIVGTQISGRRKIRCRRDHAAADVGSASEDRARGSIEMARRIKSHCSEIFRYAIPDGRCDSDPCRDPGPAMMEAAPVKHRTKLL
ncbi:phage integrase central domain-containing protein [Sphingopyxis soli]|jgi:hypothetical protein|uniref:phage integrase central domain-containing protein n=1 Tax=Sphingopyxis soli TaxID=592051 RepID=UPI003CCED400